MCNVCVVYVEQMHALVEARGHSILCHSPLSFEAGPLTEPGTN